jgi:hypothetical protein
MIKEYIAFVSPAKYETIPTMTVTLYPATVLYPQTNLDNHAKGNMQNLRLGLIWIFKYCMSIKELMDWNH